MLWYVVFSHATPVAMLSKHHLKSWILSFATILVSCWVLAQFLVLLVCTAGLKKCFFKVKVDGRYSNVAVMYTQCVMLQLCIFSV
jgi:hypothetical protein